MLRKTAITCILLSVAFPCWSKGIYLGAGLGPDTASFYQHARITQPGNFDVKDTTHLAGTGVFGSVFAGYEWECQWYLAGEVNANISSLEFKSSNKELTRQSFSSTRYKISNNYGVSILPGYKFCRSIFYGRLGYANGNFKTSTSDTSLANVSKNLNGFRAGLGIKQMISRNMAVRVEYSHINYADTSFTVVDVASTTTKRTTIRPNTNQVEFGFIYNFC